MFSACPVKFTIVKSKAHFTGATRASLRAGGEQNLCLSAFTLLNAVVDSPPLEDLTG